MVRLADMGIKAIGDNKYRFQCYVCKKQREFFGEVKAYPYQIHDARAKMYRYCCSWSCYIKALLQITADKKILSDQDVLLLQRYQKPVPWERVGRTGIFALPDNMLPEHLQRRKWERKSPV